MTTTDNRIHTWLKTLPGPFEAPSPAETLRKAWSASRVECSATEFSDSLYRYGFKPEQVGNMPNPNGSDRGLPRWLLRLPSRPLSDPLLARGAAIRNLV